MLKLRHGGKKKFFSNIERTSAPSSSSSSVLQWWDPTVFVFVVVVLYYTVLFHSLSIPSPLFLPSLLRHREKKKGDPYQSAEISDECLRKYSGCFVSFRSFEIKEGRKRKQITKYKLTQPSGITVLPDREQWKVWYIQMEYKIIIRRRK